jgi:hypothetical protein
MIDNAIDNVINNYLFITNTVSLQILKMDVGKDDTYLFVNLSLF